MQLMIDLNETLESSRRAETAITLLRAFADIIEQSGIVQSSRKPESAPEPAFGYGVTATTAATATPIPVDSDLDVEIDDGDDAPAELSTSVQLPVAPPPPVPAIVAPPPPVPAIVAAVPAPPGPAVAPALDSRGYPWDGRIHAANRATRLDGSWKNKRGVDPNMVVQVEALTRPAAAVEVPTAPLAGMAPQVAAPAAPAAPPPPPATVGNVAPAAVAPAAIDFRGLMAKIATNTTAGKLTTDQINAALAEVGLRPEEMGALVGNGPLIATINSSVDRLLAA
jgi:hypothetical protein